MARRKKVIQYTVKDHPGLLIDVEGGEDNEASRKKALDEIMKKIEEEEIDLNSFADGLGIDDLIFVDSPSKIKSIKKDEELSPIERAAKEVAQFALLKVALQKNQEAAQKYLDLITALFAPAPLTPEQIEIAQDKSFAKTLENLATAKVEFDSFAEKAKEAWKLLRPALVNDNFAQNQDSLQSNGESSKSNHQSEAQEPHKANATSTRTPNKHK